MVCYPAAANCNSHVVRHLCAAAITLGPGLLGDLGVHARCAPGQHGHSSCIGQWIGRHQCGFRELIRDPQLYRDVFGQDLTVDDQRRYLARGVNAHARSRPFFFDRG